MQMTVREIAELCGGRLLSGDPETVITGLALDSREKLPGGLFIPLKGEKTDGHKYIGSALAGGLAASLTEEDLTESFTQPILRVDSTRTALQQLGAYCRSCYKGQVWGISGSVGKTSTREMVKLALSAGGSVTGTFGNQNSQLGLPVTLYRMDLQADRAVLEMGISQPGEMERLANMARPHMGILTNIGDAHLEFMGSRETTLREKSHIFDYLGPEGVALLNGEDPLLLSLQGRTPYKTLYFGFSEACPVQAVDIEEQEGGSRFTVRLKHIYPEERRVPCRLQVPGRHMILNALAAIGAAALSGIDPAAAAGKLADFGGFERRMEVRRAGGVTVLDDSYNASPASVKAALKVLAGYSGRKLLLLGDMKELGERTEEGHKEIGLAAAALAPCLTVTLGQAIRTAEQVLEEAGCPVHHAADGAEAVAILKEVLDPGDVLLAKGSNSMGIGPIVDKLCTLI